MGFEPQNILMIDSCLTIKPSEGFHCWFTLSVQSWFRTIITVTVSFCRPNMASKSATPPDGQVKTLRRQGRRKETDVQVLTLSGHKALEDGRSRDAVRCFKAALQAAAQLQDSRVLGACFFNLGAAYLEVGEPHKALDLLQQSQPGSKADRCPDLQFNLAIAHNALGKTQEASAAFLRAAHLYRSQGNGGSEGDACMEMSRCYSQTQDWVLAARGFLRAADSYRVAAMLDCAANALKEAGSHMIRANQFNKTDISGILGECLSLTNSVSDPRILGDLFLSVGVSYCQLRCFQEAVQCFQRALILPAQQPPLLAKVLQNLGAALNSMGQFSEAVGYHRLAAGLYGSLGCHGDRARCYSNLAHAWTQLGDEDEAVESFILSLQGFRDTENHLAQVQVCQSLAECYLRQRKHQRAVQLYEQALSTLSHCKEDRARQDPLVKRLSTALQKSLCVGVEKPNPQRPQPLQAAGTTPIRKDDITHSLVPEANQQSLRFSVKRPGGLGDQRLSAEGRAIETPDDTTTVPGPYSSHPSRRHHTPDSPDVPGEQVLCREELHMSEASLAQQAESPPTRGADSSETTPPVSRGRSLFCSLM
ncbi:tetratricopeptide repeat protein 24 isoform X3 [Oryzias latipes]|uniref:tetratricopeptide repeat protein 24 isoform X3 n=1 Tax=Oryzias latipes TaxID=8090 RepID=UPI0009D9C10C|nr:tetratricopeptide repeat protein 24 isoform X3 [Oryzias latipes]